MLHALRRSLRVAAPFLVLGCTAPLESPHPPYADEFATADPSPDPAPTSSASPLAHIRFDGPDPQVRIDGVAPRFVAGRGESALGLDGYSSMAELTADTAALERAFTLSAHVATPAYPVANAAFINQYRFPDRGFFFGVEPLGRWYVAVASDGVWRTCFASEPLPKQRWAHVAATFDAAAGELALFLDGVEVARSEVPRRPMAVDTAERLFVGRDAHSSMIGGLFATGSLGGAIDEVAIYDRALDASEIRALAKAGANPPMPGADDRLTHDPHRPRWHAIPDANWTNEPHGFVRAGGRYHLFFQKNPNGPYWERIHWGHLESEDLVSWREVSMALAPDPGFDARGVWSGAAVVDGGTLSLLYTGVDGAKAGLGLARADASGTFIKRPGGPVVAATPDGYLDFRDPHVFRHESGWRMLVGSGVPGRSGAVLLYESDDLESWRFLGPALVGDRQSSGVFWEMPELLPLGGDRYALLVTTVEEDEPARALYFTGTWAGTRFVPQSPALAQELLPGLLSPTIAESADGRHVSIGIVPEARSPERQYEAGWAHAFGLPRELWPCGSGLCQRPAAELAALRGSRQSTPPGPVAGVLPLATGLDGTSLELDIELELGTASAVTLALRAAPDGSEATLLTLDSAGELTLDRRTSSLDDATVRDVRTARLPRDSVAPVHLRVFIDASLVEVFVDERLAFATRVYPTRADSTAVTLEARGGKVVLHRLEAYELTAPS